MSSERQTVLHSWCRQADWAAPVVVGGESARFHTEDGRSILEEETKLANALSLLDELLAQMLFEP